MSTDMLAKFREAKAGELEALRALARDGRLPKPYAGKRPGFSQALRSAFCPGQPAVIAEYKRASPSIGDLNLRVGPEETAQLYASAGAAAISCLTEEVYFKGSLEYLGRMAGAGLPLLRKDFLFDPLQIVATAASPASALLLIVRQNPDAGELRGLIQATLDHGLEPLVECFDAADLAIAREAGATLLQVNTRDLSTLKVDPAIALELVADKRPGELWISASGIGGAADVRAMAQVGYDAVLVGTALMEHQDPAAKLAELTGTAC